MKDDNVTRNLCNTSVTVDCNRYHRLGTQLKKTFERGKYINENEKRPFSYKDFDLKPGTFRQHMLRLNAFVELAYKDHISFYKIRGIELPGDTHRVTFRDTGDTLNLIQILKSVQVQPAMIHDVKMKIDVSIHTPLVKAGCSVNPNNHCILIKDIPITDNNIVFKASVYPHTVQLDVACTYKPIIYDVDSLLYFIEMLKEASMYLTRLTSITLPSVKDWIVTHYHLNKDGSHELNGESFHYAISDVTSGLIRLYSKRMNDGRVIPRIEQIQIPQTSITEIMKKAVRIQEQTSGEECWIN